LQEEKAVVIQTILFLSGINTLLQVHFGTRLPAVMGGSYTYIYPAVAIIISPRYLIIIDPFEVHPPFHKLATVSAAVSSALPALHQLSE
jgi:xanthine/uracil permease